MEAPMRYYEGRMSLKEKIAKPPFRFKAALNQIKKHFPGKKKLEVLDIGCNDGTFLKLCQMEGYKVDGVEINSKLRRLASKNVKIKIYDKISAIKKKKFDVVCLLEVLEHQIDPRKFLKRSSKLVRPGGLMIISVPIGYLLMDPDHKSFFDFYDFYNLCSSVSDDFDIFLLNKLLEFGPELNIYMGVIRLGR